MSAIVELHALQVRHRGNVLLGPLSLQLHAGQCTGLVGESGSGKSLTVQALLGLLPAGLHADGALHRDGEAIALGSSAHDALRGHVLGWVPQDPLASLHPLKRVGTQLVETLRAVRGMTRAASNAEAHRLLDRVHLPDATASLRRYPHEFSGGQRQRIAIALALATSPRVLIADEPTSALDSRIAREVLDLLDTLRREEGLAILLVSHDLPLVGAYAQDVLVLHRGKVVERGAVDAVFDAPTHPCTRELLAAGERHVDAAKDGTRGALVLQASGLRLRYRGAVQDAVDGVDLQLHRGEALAVVGESGSGKSSLARVLLRLARAAEGRLVLHPREGAPVDLMGATASTLRALRPRVGVVFQDPFASLDPRMRIADVVGEPLRLTGALSRSARRTQVAGLLQAVGLPDDSLDRYPHEFSGGQRQRIAIARALASEPDLLVCDEAISALDAQHRGAILRLLARLKSERGLAIVFITHDLDSTAAIAETIAVMEHGRIVETGPTLQVLAAPRHPHTRALVDSRPAPRMRAI